MDAPRRERAEFYERWALECLAGQRCAVVPLLGWAEAEMELGGYERALAVVSQLVLPPAPLRWDVAMLRGRLCRRLTRWGEAVDCFREALRIGQTAEQCLLARLCLGSVAAGRGQLATGRVTAKLVRRLAREAGSPDTEARASLECAVYESRMSLPIEAIVSAYRAVDVTNDPHLQARALAVLGAQFAKLGHLEAAKLSLELIAERSAEWEVRTDSLIELLGVSAGLGDTAQVAVIREHLAASEAQMPPRMRVDLLIQLAGVDRAVGRVAAADWHLRLASRLADDAGIEDAAARIEQHRAGPPRRAATRLDERLAPVVNGLTMLALEAS